MILIEYSSNGECIGSSVVPRNVNLNENQEIKESDDLNRESHHKEPYLTQYKLSKIREKQKELIKNYSYIPGLSVGEMRDEEWQSWIESVITFTDDYKDLEVIEDSVINFPTTPDGDSAKIEF